ncbi:ABC transporter ATP-binding protein [Anaeromyxobacter diazotrophicus]|uniref:ABC transporter ATP-binding protein n=1 Tax=Anaeromyxobacter diazotrophicus TaxID=2590199 RepID=A0A7I9VKU6_9BACT|nr:ABC transporter ATP-binding protein [Anaeromyxobacter diazotrophicus]GEJ57015.1 ABC transporter ATP-binding protein [Anaeromyxobacter diazotrophicus]
MIRFERVSKRYGRHVALSGLSLEVRRGEVVALLGPNGSGKTTTLKAAAGLVHPSEGTVMLGEPPRPAAEPDARRTLSYLPQKVAFPEALTGREVVEFYRRLRGLGAARTDEALHVAALNGAGARQVGTYSGGMVQRLGLAVAALPDAPVLLLDEPTSSLDTAGLGAVYALAVRARREGRAVLFTSHQPADVERLADRVAVLVGGRLVALLGRGELAERLAARGVLRARVERVPPGLGERLASLAPGAAVEGDQVVVPGDARTRAAALQLLAEAGARVRQLAAEEGRLDLLYQELAGGDA